MPGRYPRAAAAARAAAEEVAAVRGRSRCRRRRAGRVTERTGSSADRSVSHHLSAVLRLYVTPLLLLCIPTAVGREEGGIGPKTRGAHKS